MVDPRRTSSAQWADLWLGLDVGSDISLANAMGREIIVSGLANEAFIRHATSGFEAYRQCVEKYTLDRAERETGVPAEAIGQTAHAYAKAKSGQICWTLGITEHHNAVDNVVALINLALLTGHVGRYGSGVNPLRGQNNVQGGGDMGAIPDRLTGFQHLENPELRAKFERAWRAKIEPKRGWHLSAMFDAMERGELTLLYVLGENPVDSEADRHHARKMLGGLEFLVVQDLFYTKTAELANVVLPGSAGWCESDGTVTNSERRVQRVRRVGRSEHSVMYLRCSRTGTSCAAAIAAARTRCREASSGAIYPAAGRAQVCVDHGGQLDQRRRAARIRAVDGDPVLGDVDLEVVELTLLGRLDDTAGGHDLEGRRVLRTLVAPVAVVLPELVEGDR